MGGVLLRPELALLVISHTEGQSQNQGRLEGLRPPHLNPDLILLPCGELSELQLL